MDGTRENMKAMAAMPSRERYWSEIDSIEKCERLRREVKRLQRTVRELNATVYQLKRHEHGGNGEVCVPMSAGTDGIEDCAVKIGGDDCYF